MDYWTSRYLRRLFHKFTNWIVGFFVKSPLEEDFGDVEVFKSAQDEDYDADTAQQLLPDSNLSVELPVDSVHGPLLTTFHHVEGLRSEQMERLKLRIQELPFGRVAEFRFQVKDGGRPVELQVNIVKSVGNGIRIDFCCSEGIIEEISRIFDVD